MKKKKSQFAFEFNRALGFHTSSRSSFANFLMNNVPFLNFLSFLTQYCGERGEDRLSTGENLIIPTISSLQEQERNKKERQQRFKEVWKQRT